MASNGKPQFERFVFSQQSNGAAGKRGDASVRQDKTALARGHAATQQPEPHANLARSQPLDTKTTRTKKHGSSKRKTVQLIFWVNPIVKAALQRLATQEGLSLSSDYSENTCFQLLGTRTPSRVTLPPDGSVRAEGFLRQTHDPGSLIARNAGSDATAPSVS